MNFLKQDTRQLGKKLISTLWFLGEHAFVATLFFVLGAGVIAALLFWQYVIFSPQEEKDGVVSEVEFREEIFNALLFQLEQEAASVEGANLLNPRDLFNPSSD